MATDRGIDFHGKTIQATILSAQRDLWGITVQVVTDELGGMVSVLRYQEADHLVVGDVVPVKVYCSNLTMAPLFTTVLD